MAVILKNDGFAGARSIFPTRLEFAFYEVALPAVQYRDAHLQSLGGGWYCYSWAPWFFTYRMPVWTERQIEAHRARIRRFAW
ncbi:MAG TPA: hypothetical protein VFZ14_11880 [Burkholderiales bacterium]|nr:hypothetical protein [Burkholderiales bacterium]